MTMTMRNDPVLNRKLIAILDDLIEVGHWDKSLFLQATGKDIKNLRDKLATDLDLVIPEETHPEEEEARVLRGPETIPAEKMEVFVALYQAEGSRIQNWENALELLLARSSSRPIYHDEVHAKDMLLRKGNTANNAYVAILINKADIIPMPEKHVMDKFGHELLTVREDALKLDNVRRFIHSTGTYFYRKKHLVKQKVL